MTSERPTFSIEEQLRSLPAVFLVLDGKGVIHADSVFGRFDEFKGSIGRGFDELEPTMERPLVEVAPGDVLEVRFLAHRRVFVGTLERVVRDDRDGFQVFAVDATPAVRREEEVGRRERELQLLVDTALDPVITCDESSTIIAWNSSASELFGWSADEAIGKTLTETIIPTDLRAAHDAGMKRYKATGEGPVLGARIEIEAVDRAGRRFPIELSINAIVMPDRRVFSAFIRDISARVESEARLVGSESRLQSALDAMQAGAWEYTLDGSGGLIDAVVDDRVRDLLGPDADRLPRDREQFHPDDRDATIAAWEAASQATANRYDVEYRIHSGDDRVLWRREVGVLVASAEDDPGYEGKPTGAVRMIGVVQDVTRERELEETLASARKLEAVGQVASGFAHDLNNVLSAISGHATLATLAPDLPAKSVQSMEVIKDAVARGRALTQNMLSLGRPNAAQRDRIELADLVEETLKLADPVLGAAIHVERRIATGIGWIESDANQWQQAILNLVINARDAMAGQGRLEVSVQGGQGSGEDGCIVLELRDSGQGMSPETIEMATRPFFTTKGKKGTGLGLAMVQRLVESESGRLEIESALGEGTTIRIVVPVQREKATPGVAAESCHVFLVEDHPLLRPMLAESLTNCGFEVTAISDGGEALEQITNADPTVLVLDINLPGRRGDELAAEARHRLGREVPVLFITGNNDFDPPDWAGIGFLRKPFELEDLNRKVRELAS